MKNMATVVQVDCKSLLATECDEASLCQDCFNQAGEIVDLTVRSLKRVISDVYELLKAQNLRTMRRKLLNSRVGVEKSIQEIEALSNWTQTTKHRLQEWSATLVDIEAHYRQVRFQQWNSARNMRAG